MPQLGENESWTEDPMAFAYLAAMWQRPSDDAASLGERGAVIVAERWLRHELESDGGIRFNTPVWMVAMRWLGVAGPSLLERVCKDYVHSSHAPKLEGVGWLILNHWSTAARRSLVLSERLVHAYITIGLRLGLFSVDRVSACIAGADSENGIPPYWATEPVRRCLKEWRIAAH